MSRRAAALVVFIYVFAFPYHPALRSPNELSRLWLARAVVDFHTLSLNETLSAYGHVGDLSFKDGRFYISKAPLLSMLAIPLYAALKAQAQGDGAAVSETELVYWARLLFTVLPSLFLLAILSRFLLSYVPLDVAQTAWLTFALGSLGFSYALLFMSHQLVAVLLFAAFFVLWRAARSKRATRIHEVAAGALCALALCAEYTAALGVGALVLYAWLSRSGPPVQRIRAAGYALLGAVPFLLALMAYHQACFGHPLESGYRYLADTAYQPWHTGGFLGIRVPDGRALALSFMSPLRGLFALCPFLLLAFVGLRPLRTRDAPLFWLSVTMLAGYTYFTASFSYDSWGWTSGPRHLTPLVPFLILPAALGLARLKQTPTLAGIGWGSAVASVLITGALSFVNYIPDDVSDALFALALPLFSAGDWPPTMAAAFGSPSASSHVGILLIAALASALLMLGSWAPRSRRSIVALVLTICVGVGFHRLAWRDDRADRAAAAFLHQVWLTR